MPEEWCHASCCCGETRLDLLPEEAVVGHRGQLQLDILGYPSGYFGSIHEDLTEAVGWEAMRKGLRYDA